MNENKYTIGVVGASGYAGGEVLRLLLGHPHFHLDALIAHSRAGQNLAAVHPHLAPWGERILEPLHTDRLAELDVIVLALPHGASAPIIQDLRQRESHALIVDCGADFRLRDADQWRRYYGTEHAGTFPYGLPELIHHDGTRQRDLLRGARSIAVPGCNVTALTLALAPLVRAQAIDPQHLVAALAVGYSGAGKKAADHLLAAEGLGGATPYAVGGTHRHIPEILQNLACAGAHDAHITMTPILVPMSRGILATVTAQLIDGYREADLRELMHEAYADEPFVHLLPPGIWPTTKAVQGSNNAQLNLVCDQRSGTVTVLSAIDNLVKGTAGQALQAIHLALGLDETCHLPRAGLAP
ncbi:N-acetyl-gamma-glutamyl-phosphate reductase [Devriesea agamarum]|uniref:N-acetyl-gamma-glutamyl-phosphate reductase n=1 Tax=Devriesea agamarum TaxID=472569 RepID=UPI00071E6130|nr:N-acetyl-gamma-glutamyl-phosphate reductase [Devriesea agamarum]